MLTREGLKPGGCTLIHLWNEAALSRESVNWTYKHFYSQILSGTRFSYIQREEEEQMLL